VVVVGVSATVVVLLETEVVRGADGTVSVRITVWAGSVTVRTSVVVVSVLVATCATAVGTACLAFVSTAPDPQAPTSHPVAIPATSAVVSLAAPVARKPETWLIRLRR
jgi:hypothetical protein